MKGTEIERGSQRRISRRTFLKTLAAGSAVGLMPYSWLMPSKARATDHPNVLLLMSDQHNAQCMGCADPLYVTPALDKLAAGGVRFTNCFTTSPACAPARSSLMTGRPPHQTGVFFNRLKLRLGTRTIGNFLRRRGYQTAYFGKWDLGGRPDQFGFTTAGRGNVRLGDHMLMSDDVFKYIGHALDASWPYFMTVSWLWPHPPLFLVDKYVSAYPLASMEIPNSYTDTLWDKPAWYQRRSARRNLTESKVQLTSRTYATMISQVDEWLGMVLQALGKRGLLENTIIIYTSDHGETLGAHHLRGKFVAFDESARVPLIMLVPHVSSVRPVIDDIVSLGSIPATIIEAAGFKVPIGYSYASLMTAFQRSTPPEEEAVYYGFPSYRAIRTRSLKFVHHDSDISELYDLELDPDEMINRILFPSYGEDKELLSQRLEEWWTETGGPQSAWPRNYTPP